MVHTEDDHSQNADSVKRVEDGTQSTSSAAGTPEPPLQQSHQDDGGMVKERIGMTQAKNEADTVATNDDEEPQRSKGTTAIIMLALGIAVFLAAIDVTIITTALPSISEHFGSTAGYTWIGSAYLLGNAASTPLWGKFSDIWGRKPVLLIANVVFFIGSLLAGVAVNIGMLIVARAIQGVGGGGLVILVNICIGDLFSMRKRSAYYGIIGGVWAIASALGPIMGGAFSQFVTWRWCFYINLPLDGIAFVIIFFFLDLHNPRTPLWEGIKAIDWLGALLITGGTVMFLLGLEFGGITHPWKSATVLCLIVFGAFTIFIFFLNEWKLAKYPIIPLRIFQHRSNLAALGVCFCHGANFVAASYFLPLYFQVVLGATPILSGVYYLPTVLALSFASAGVGVLIRKTGLYLPPIWAGMALMTLGTGLFIDLTPTSSWAKIILYQAVAGIGVGPNFQSPLIALQSGISPRDIASATATFGFTRNLGTAISVVIGTVVFQNVMESHTAELTAAVGGRTAAQLSGANAVANVGVANALPEVQRDVVRTAFAASLSKMWIMYTVIAFVGLVSGLFIRKNQLRREHKELKQGLEGEVERKKEADEARRIRKEETKRQSGKLDGIAEKV
ncbi:MFS general substrate transporter [Pseudovirgaria hyperparasitica]|uniref:Efflux pump dotC n=1 Tax=Pseudovirgaria hyperparasitica TaxID=470096 RepID=A0A6A6VUD0_9PEZI|nr:MFS general substrate transporter [Pseudovirgaria hyperparasitica]KAF2754182.1 MFS general substrate transporter [Pseudovirgaria hyperparasitica]